MKKYRSREQVEDFFRDDKDYADAKRPLDWTRDTLQGKLFIQFVCLCYRDYYLKLLSNMKEQLGKKNGDKTHDTKESPKKELELLSWLNNLSIYHQQLTWFDAVDTVLVKTGFLAKRWKTETIERDRLFLSKLGMRDIY